MKLLSICIPTYNRKEKLKKLLDLIEYEINCNNLKDKIEICVSDNASKDNIQEMLEEKFQSLDIKFNRNFENKGFDYNLDMTTKLATGKYIWFCGDDDEILENSLIKILDIIKNEEAEIYILNGQLKNKKKIKNFNALKAEHKKIYRTINEDELCTYIDNINNNLSFLCAFITSLVVKREIYLSEKIPINLKNSAYDHMYKLLKILKNGCTIMYLADEYYSVGITENDWNKERGKHFLLDITSLYRFLNNLYPEYNLKLSCKIGKLLNRCSGNIGMIYSINYAKRKKSEKELIESMSYFEIYSIKNKVFKLFFSNNFVIKILDILIKIKRGI